MLDEQVDKVVRRHVVDFSESLVEKGWNWNETAELLGLAPRTLRDWRLDFDRNQLRAVALGRPMLGATREERNLVIRHIDEAGPGFSLAALRLKFTEMSRAELDDILHRYRRLWRKRNRRPLHVLHWPILGAVWVIDFHGPRPLIDGLRPYLLAVRDLASGHVLLWLPVDDPSADTVVRAVIDLFTVRGAPLVLKSDNGSAFIAAELRQLIKNFGVKNLYSPPHAPRVQLSASKQSIGSLKIRTEAHAARHGHPGSWTWDDVAAARRSQHLPSPQRRPVPAPTSCGTPARPSPNSNATASPSKSSNDFLHQSRPRMARKTTTTSELLDCEAISWYFLVESPRLSFHHEEVNSPTDSQQKSGRHYVRGTVASQQHKAKRPRRRLIMERRLTTLQ